MSITTVTAYPSKYANQPRTDGAARANAGTAEGTASVGGFYLRFNLLKAGSRRYAGTPRRLLGPAKVIGAATGIEPAYDSKNKYYRAGGWRVYASLCDGGTTVYSSTFDIDKAEGALRVLDALRDAGYVPDGQIDIRFTPDAYDLRLARNLCNIIAARSALIAQALELDEEIRIFADEYLAFGVALSAFSFEKIEACLYLLRQASLMAANTGKSRMKSRDERNPKYRMRSWLLRLGFIGDQFARPRRTLLSGLEGDGSFFSDDSRKKAAIKRKAKLLAG